MEDASVHEGYVLCKEVANREARIRTAVRVLDLRVAAMRRQYQQVGAPRFDLVRTDDEILAVTGRRDM
jgi:hypothetical protein